MAVSLAIGPPYGQHPQDAAGKTGLPGSSENEGQRRPEVGSPGSPLLMLSEARHSDISHHSSFGGSEHKEERTSALGCPPRGSVAGRLKPGLEAAGPTFKAQLLTRGSMTTGKGASLWGNGTAPHGPHTHGVLHVCRALSYTLHTPNLISPST